MEEAVQNPGRNGSDGNDEAENDYTTVADNKFGCGFQKGLRIESV